MNIEKLSNYYKHLKQNIIKQKIISQKGPL